MSNQKVATDFDLIIQADRQRRKNEELAKSIFSKKKPKDSGNRRDNQRGANSPSLASRIGVTKRSSSTSSIPSPRLPPTRPSSNVAQNARANRIAAEINSNQNANIKPSPKTSGPGFSIKGSAAPFVVEARNFAPGTTDADIESAIQADCIDNSGINTLVSCRIISTKPTVVAEMVFTERSIAERIIERYHKQKADGRVLELRLARSGPGSMSKSQVQPSSRDTSAPASIPASVPAPEPETAHEPSETEMEDIETEQPQPKSSDAYDDERQAAERDRRDRESRRTDREGYESNSNNNTSSRRRDDERRDERYRERDGERDRDRERERDRTQDRDYERRDDGNNNRSFNNRPDEPRGGGRPSHYGNGVGGSRPGYGGGFGGAQGSYRGGRTYSDDTRGGFGGRGGGYRGAWRPYR